MSNEWEHARGYKEALISGDTIAIFWSVEDVIYYAEDMGLVLTNEQARDILSDIRRHHDACIGVNWDSIGEWIRIYDSNLMLGDSQGLPRIKTCKTCATPTSRCTC